MTKYLKTKIQIRFTTLSQIEMQLLQVHHFGSTQIRVAERLFLWYLERSLLQSENNSSSSSSLGTCGASGRRPFFHNSQRRMVSNNLLNIQAKPSRCEHPLWYLPWESSFFLAASLRTPAGGYTLKPLLGVFLLASSLVRSASGHP